MIGRRNSRRSATELAAGPPPSCWGVTPNRPSRFVAKPELVRAVWHDGSDAQVALATEWVQQVSGDCEMKVEAQPGPVLVIQPAWPAEPVRWGPGMFLVQRAAGWTVYSADQLLAASEPLPRELPIFDDGEVA